MIYIIYRRRAHGGRTSPVADLLVLGGVGVEDGGEPAAVPAFKKR